VEISYAVSGYQRTATTGSDGTFRFTNIPFNTYPHGDNGEWIRQRDARRGRAVQCSYDHLGESEVGHSATSVTVEANGGDLLETESTFHTDVDRGLFDKMPLESQSSSVSSLVTLASPGVVADSNGLFHGLGDHAENSFSVDGQPITDQQSKVFSNQIPVESIQSLEVISGAPPAEFGDKTSLVIKVTTRSGLGQTKPTGSVRASYGSVRLGERGLRCGVRRQKWGNFCFGGWVDTGRFLDPPEFQVMHAKGNQQNVFDRVDFQ